MIIQCKAADGKTYPIEIEEASPVRNLVSFIPPQEENGQPRIIFHLTYPDGRMSIADDEHMEVGKHLLVMSNPMTWNVGPEVFIWGGLEKGLVPVTNVLDYGLFGGYLVQDGIVQNYHSFIEQKGHVPLICELDATKCQRKNGFSSVNNGSSIILTENSPIVTPIR